MEKGFKGNMLHVVFITDEKYLLPTKVAVRSLVKNAAIDTYGTIYIVVSSESQEYETLKELQNSHFKIEIISVLDETIKNYKGRHLYVSTCALYKFLLADILPDVKKVLYLDGDILVKSDLQQLYDCDIETLYLAAVEDMCAVKDLKVNLSMGQERYFNSGVMLLNLELMRKEKISIELLKERIKDSNLQFMDQNVLNKILGEKVLYISPKYNYMKANLCGYSGKQIIEFYNITTEEYYKLLEKPAILHLTSHVKPWNSYKAQNFSEWCSYLESEEIGYIIENICKVLEQQMNNTLISKLKIENESSMLLFKEQQKQLDELKEKINLFEGIDKDGTNVQEKKIVIYGAGHNAIRIFKKCHEAGRTDEILAFAVSDTSENVGALCGVQVVNIESLQNRCNDLTIIVSVSKYFLVDVLEKLEELGFSSVIENGIDYKW